MSFLGFRFVFFLFDIRASERADGVGFTYTGLGCGIPTMIPGGFGRVATGFTNFLLF